MSWYSEHPTHFPNAVQRVALSEGSIVQSYRIHEACCVSGMELYYRAEEITTGAEITLCEFLPMRWCMQDETGTFLPYQAEAGIQWNAVRASAMARLQYLLNCQEEALPQLLEVFENRGTIWYAAQYREMTSLHTLVSEKIIAPSKAVHMLAPMMDALAGLHEESMFHGNISAASIRISGDTCELRDWNSYEARPDALSDVRAVSRLLYQMMTGETEYRSMTAASLPKGIRNALYNGMYDPDMTIGTLWQQLHAKKPVKRIRTAHTSSGSTGLLGRIVNPLATGVFCLGCLAVPLIWRMQIHAPQEVPAPAETPKMPDVTYALSNGELKMPELLYLPQEEAIQKLEALGLRVIFAKREDNPVVPENNVVTQIPDAGTIVRAGDVVTLSVSDGWKNYVPDVCNMLLEDATEKLENLGFAVEYKEVVSDTDAPGTVVEQNIKPETHLERDSVIRLTVSLGREDLDASKMEEVGDYVGMEFEKAKAQLTEKFLYAMQVETVYDPKIPAGVVISQDVPEGKKVPQGTIINMKVSMGVETTRVPSVVMMNANAAKETLEAAGLICVICYVSNSDYVMDCVLSQNVEAGTLAAVGSQVWLNASIGSGSYVVSTGGWSGNPLPTVELEETSETEETEEENPDDTEENGDSENTDSAAQPATDPPEETVPPVTDPPYTNPPATDPPYTNPPATEPPVVQTEPPYIPDDDLTAPPMEDWIF